MSIKALLIVLKPLFLAVTQSLVGDTFKAVWGRIQWTVVLERLLTRLMIGLLLWIRRLSTNDVVDETVDLIAQMLEQKRLAKAREYQRGLDQKPSTATSSNKDL